MNRPNSQANATSGDVSDVNNSSGVYGLSQDKMDQLVALLQQASLIPSSSLSTSSPVTNHISFPQVSSIYTTPSSSGIINATMCSSLFYSFWLIDSGANEHIFCNLNLVSSYHPISPVPVTLPNGSIVTVTHSGKITFSSQFYLTNVLYSPHFKLNLMSVAKVCESLSCVFQFSLNQCIIQDSTTLKMTGLANQQDGLYKFHASSVSTNKVSYSLNSSVCNIPVSCN